MLSMVDVVDQLHSLSEGLPYETYGEVYQVQLVVQLLLVYGSQLSNLLGLEFLSIECISTDEFMIIEEPISVQL